MINNNNNNNVYVYVYFICGGGDDGGDDALKEVSPSQSSPSRDREQMHAMHFKQFL